MKKLNTLVLGFAVAMGLSSCIKDGDQFDPAAQFELERPIVRAYAEANLGNPRFHEETGIWYEVVAPGDGAYQYKLVSNPNNPSNRVIEAPDITVIYTGTLVETDVVVESNDDDGGDKKSLGNVPAAWQFAFLPEEILYDEDGELLDEPIKFANSGGLTEEGLTAGSVIRIVSPSFYIYGNQSVGSVPANSPMYYEIEVVAIEAPDAD
ncbi:FKBP-type peptidyl-prolyl cis-trans isomerase [Parapedobacter composti]|nr:hypothetical protein [Parapedobacter composti]